MQHIMDSTFKTAEVAAALEHGNFGVWRRNYTSDKLNCLPPFEDAGRGEYNYAQIAEMTIHISATATHTRDIAHMVTWGILDRLLTEKVHSKEYQEAWSTLSARSDELAHQEHCPVALDPLMLAPAMFFGEDVISRDPNNRTWALYSISGAPAGVKPRVKLLQEGDSEPITLKDVREAAYRLATDNAADERAIRYYEEDAHRPHLMDLTGIFNRFEDILNFRLQARTVGRR